MTSQDHKTEADSTETRIEAAVFRRLLKHLDENKQVQNIELMLLADFCRNCLAKWYKTAADEEGLTVNYDEARELVYGMPYAEWKQKFEEMKQRRQQMAEQMAKQPSERRGEGSADRHGDRDWRGDPRERRGPSGDARDGKGERRRFEPRDGAARPGFDRGDRAGGSGSGDRGRPIYKGAPRGEGEWERRPEHSDQYRGQKPGFGKGAPRGPGPNFNPSRGRSDGGSGSGDLPYYCYRR